MRKTAYLVLVCLLFAFISSCASTPTVIIKPPPVEREVKFIGLNDSAVFHYPWCYHIRDSDPKKKVKFYSYSDAVEIAGKRPCAHCKPVPDDDDSVAKHKW